MHVEFLVSVRVEWHRTGDHFENDDAQRPPVYRLAVRFYRNYFRSQILWGTAQGCCPFGNPLAQPEVRKQYVTVGVNEHVLGLQIPNVKLG